MRLSITQKMVLLSTAIFVALTAIGLISMMTNDQTKESLQLQTIRNQQIQKVDSILVSHLNLMLAAMDSIIDRDEGQINPERTKTINENINFIEASLSTLSALSDTPEEKALSTEIANHFSTLKHGIQVLLVNLIQSRASIDKFAEMDNILDTQGDAIEEKLFRIKHSVKLEVAEAEEEAQKVLTNSTTYSMAAFIFAVLLIAPLLFFISKTLIRTITETSEQLYNGSSQVAEAANQISATSNSLAENASKQAAAVEETSSSMEEISSMTKRDAANAKEVDTLMTGASTMTKEAEGAMDRLNSSMQDIAAASMETQKIVKTIDEIAFQTNLLALNAAVEAARAGEAGAGFAVVADEVRNLAMRAAEAAKDTSLLIEGTVSKVSTGTKLVEEAGTTFREASASTGKISTLLNEIALSAEQQALAINQVGQGMHEVDSVSQATASASEEAAAASQELSGQADMMRTEVLALLSFIHGHAPQQETASYTANMVRKAPQPAQPASQKTKSLPHSTPPPVKAVIPFDDDEFEDF